MRGWTPSPRRPGAGREGEARLRRCGLRAFGGTRLHTARGGLPPRSGCGIASAARRRRNSGCGAARASGRVSYRNSGCGIAGGSRVDRAREGRAPSDPVPPTAAAATRVVAAVANLLAIHDTDMSSFVVANGDLSMR